MARAPIQAILVLFLLVLITPLSGAHGEEAIDWDSHAEEQTVTVVTADEGGSVRETTAWLAVLDGQGYIRTGGTRWGGNIERSQDIALRIGETELLLRVEFVTDEAQRDAVKAAFREKYGFSDWLLNPLRGSNPKIMRLNPRAEE
jgi:hypothetical protein